MVFTQRAVNYPEPKSSSGASSKNEDDDAAVVEQAKQGSRLAKQALYVRHVELALGLAHRLLGGGGDVDDVVQDAFIKAFARLQQLRDPARFRAWFSSIVVNVARRYLRRQRLRSRLGIGDVMSDAIDSVASDSAPPSVQAELRDVYRRLHRMPTDIRIAFTLRYVERLQLEEIASLTATSLSTVKRRIQYAERKLRFESGQEDAP